MKFLLFPLLLLISLSSHSNDFKFVCHTQSFVQANSDEKKRLRLRNTDESGKINSKQIIVVIKKDNKVTDWISFYNLPCLAKHSKILLNAVSLLRIEVTTISEVDLLNNAII